MRRGSWCVFLRPRQWPILTCQLAVGVLAAPAAVGNLRGGGAAEAIGETPRWLVLAAAWLAWVVGLNGGTLAYNSAHDRDTHDIAYLRHPPAPPPGLAGRALALMLAGVGVGLVVAPAFAAVVAACVALSVLYSHPRARLKGIPGADLAVNMAGYGAATTLAGLIAGQAAWRAATVGPDLGGWLLTAGFACLFGSFYPLTQLYQLDSDRARGDRTLAGALGPRGSLVLSCGLGAAAVPCFIAAAAAWDTALFPGATPRLPLAPLAALGAWLGHVIAWLARARRLDAAAHERGMYRALLLWAAVDAALLAHLYGTGAGD